MAFLCCFASPPSPTSKTNNTLAVPTLAVHPKGELYFTSITSISSACILVSWPDSLRRDVFLCSDPGSPSRTPSTSFPLVGQSCSIGPNSPNVKQASNSLCARSGANSGDNLTHIGAPASKALGHHIDKGSTAAAGAIVHSSVTSVGVPGTTFQTRSVVVNGKEPGVILREVAAINASPASGSHISSTQVGGTGLTRKKQTCATSIALSWQGLSPACMQTLYVDPSHDFGPCAVYD